MPELPIDFTVSPVGGAAGAHPDVAAYQQQQQAAAERQRQQAHADAMARAQEQEAPLVIQQHKQALAEGQHRQLSETMMGDIAASATHPALIGKDFSTLSREQPDYVRSFYDRYGPAVSELPAGWNQTQRNVTGDPSIGGGTSRELSQVRLTAAKLGIPGAESMGIPDLTEAIAKRQQEKVEQNVPRKTKEELVHLGKWKEGMTSEDAQDALEKGYLETGRIPDRLIPAANSFASQLRKDVNITNFAKQKGAYDTMRSGFEKPDEGGFSDMALIEGFQRLVNPGAVVRQQTMNNMLAAAGIARYGNWDFLVNHIKQGNKLDDASRKRLMDLGEKEWKNAQRQAASSLAGARVQSRLYGFPDNFVEAVLPIVAQGEVNTGAPGPTGQPGPDPAAVEWLKNNPTDPRAAGIRKALGLNP